MKNKQEYIESLIDLIKWYRDEYHKQDFGHTKYIKELSDKNIADTQIEIIQKVIDSWLD